MSQFDLNILDFSGAFSEEGLGDALRSLTASERGFRSVVIDCRDIEGTNCYCEAAAASEILRRFRRERLSSSDGRGSSLQVNWIDTGDYHHLSKMTVSEAALENGSLTLIQIDHHPDMQEPAFGGILSCGGWLRSLLEECPQVENAFVLGIDPALEGECGGFGDRVTVCNETVVGTDPGMTDRLCEAVRGRKVFLSVDKDALGREWSRTDWDHGTMNLGFLESIVRRVAEVSDLVGIDICGGITSAKGATGDDFTVNLRTDLRLLELIATLPEKKYL